ncbi:alpha/beta fold hydrolase [Oceanicaulis sp.]|uniref:alpha/beta hydrolase n=1 Tax=Oceanicaulis sp. TaxID=1924941 RepID=UPI003F7203EA
MRLPQLFLSSAFTLFAAGCATTSAPMPAPTGEEMAFERCEDAGAFAELSDSLCAMIAAPFHPETPNAGSLDLFVRKFPAQGDRVGEIWMLAGGPGETGQSYYTEIDNFRAAFPGYDVFIPDHRGTGRSSRLCAGETPDSPAGTALAGQEFGPCFGEIWENSDRTTAFSMTNAAHDLDCLIDEVGGEGRRYVYGVSYGTGLAMRFTQLRTVSVDGVVLDSLVPALDDDTHDLSRRSHIYDAVGREVIARCAADSVCDARFEGGVDTAFNQLIAEIDAGERPDLQDYVPGGNLKHALGMMLDTPESRALIADALVLAIETPDALPAFFETEVTPAFDRFAAVQAYPDTAFSITLAGLIGESETNRRPDMTAEDVAQEETGLGFTSSLTTVQTFTQMPLYERDAYFNAPYENLPPILVLHGDLDPKTHIDGARRHIEDMREAGGEVELVVVEDAPHAVWFFAQTCVQHSLDAFFNDQSLAASCSLDQAMRPS